MPQLLVGVTALSLIVAIAAVSLVVSRTGSSGGGRRGEIFLQPAPSTGPNPFTDSVAVAAAVPLTPSGGAAPLPAAGQATVKGTSGGSIGLYGGTQDLGSCNPQQLVGFLAQDPVKANAWVAAFNSDSGLRWSGGTVIRSDQISQYVAGLTPVVLRSDTRVTNHGFADGQLTTFQSVLQTGTAVLVDGYGVPRVRCACGNPLTAPVAVATQPVYAGQAWSSFRPSTVIVVVPPPTVVENFVIVDVSKNRNFERHSGSAGDDDRPAPPGEEDPPTPAGQESPSPSPSPSHEGRSPSPSPSRPGESSPSAAATASPSGSPSAGGSPSPKASASASPSTSSSASARPSASASNASPSSQPSASRPPGNVLPELLSPSSSPLLPPSFSPPPSSSSPAQAASPVQPPPLSTPPSVPPPPPLPPPPSPPPPPPPPPPTPPPPPPPPPQPTPPPPPPTATAGAAVVTCPSPPNPHKPCPPPGG